MIEGMAVIAAGRGQVVGQHLLTRVEVKGPGGWFLSTTQTLQSLPSTFRGDFTLSAHVEATHPHRVLSPGARNGQFKQGVRFG
ncbi:hypothetical protein ElyMa_006387300 [Elysia marginata]|uniref:Uncharacterized protein n=1 Tax=Elysia marginata TaxID=1093978 RepID=A0AAV4HS31_9GAST|nr:hypothetical protein ElyMa_006387300 [Elysia marginata]